MTGIKDRGDSVGGRIDRARFLKLMGLGAGLSAFPGSLLSANVAGAQAFAGPEILDPKGPYPIAAWWPPPPVPNTNPDPQAETNGLYADLAGAGFNVAIGGNGVSNERANRLALEACEKYGVRLVLADAELSNAIEGTATTARTEGQDEPEGVLQALTEQDSQQDVQAQAAANKAAITRRLDEIYSGIEGRIGFGEHPALAGIFLYDEPGTTLFDELRFAKEEVDRIFGPGELPYANAWPSYADPKSALEAPNYADYLRQYTGEMALPFLSFDHYPLLAGDKITPDFFYNHAVIRNLARRFRVPSWGFVQSMGFDGRAVRLAPRRRPDEAEIFWQVNVALAYGVKGIQYFTYWTPQNNAVKFGDALITRAGSRTALYAYADRANAFLERVGAVLRPLNSLFVTHFGEQRLPRGAQPFKGYPLYVNAASGDAAILGLFSNPAAPAQRYLLVVNRSPNRASRTRLTIAGTVKTVEEFDPSRRLFRPRALADAPPRFLTVSLGAGRSRLYRLSTA